MNAHETHQEGRSAAMGTGVASEHTVDAAAVVASHEHRLTFAQRSGDPLCERCLRPWRGDAESGGCEVVLLARRVIALEGMAAAFREYERVGREVDALRGHAPDMHAEYRRVGEAYNRFCALAEAAGEGGGG